jgi:hypothetical protein
VFARKFNLDIYGSTIGAAMTVNVGFAVLSYTNDSAVFGVKLSDRVVSSNAAVLTEGHDNLVL